MNTLRFAGDAFSTLRAALLRDQPRESAAILLAEHVPVSDGSIFLVRQVLVVPPQFARASEYQIDIAPEFIARALKTARIDGTSVFFAHSHPFATRAQFSAQDDQGEEVLLPTMFQRAGGRPHGALVLTESDVTARLYRSPHEVSEAVRVVENARILSSQGGSGDLDLTQDRTVRALGLEAQRRLRQLRVGVVGLGGTGSVVVQELAHLGVGAFVLLDPDVVDATNLNRLVGSSQASVGVAKVDVARSMVRTIRSDSSVEAVRGDVRFERDARRLLDMDLIFCCTDSHGSRAVLNQFAYQYFVPVIDMGVRIDAREGEIDGVVGRVQALAPGLACLVCEGLLDSEQVRRDLLDDAERERDPYIVGALEPQPAVISINSVVGSLAVTMFLAITCGFPLDARHQMFLAHRGVVRTVTATPNAGCFVCSSGGALGRGTRARMPWRLA
jgi:molybdopterin-synthase adenylyltransferase